MKRIVLEVWTCVAAMIIGSVWVKAQTEEEAVRAAMYLSGASAPEEIDEGEAERIHAIGKIRVNAPGRNARAVLSEYQLATLEDYRKRCGDILSWEELALVDGFGKEAVEALKPFLSLWSANLPGVVDTSARKISGNALVRLTEKRAGTKIKAQRRTWQAGVAVRSQSWPIFAGTPDWTAHAELNLGRWCLTLGDFNIRYGQGVGAWSGFSMTSLSTVGAFSRRASGITPVLSFLPSEHRGAAVEYRNGRCGVTAFADLDGMAGVHASYVSLHSLIGLTAMSGLISADCSLNWKGVHVAGEVAAKTGGAFAGKGVASFKAGNTRLAFQVRVLPTRFSGKKNGEYAIAAGAEWKSPQWRQLTGKSGFGSSVPVHSLSFTADASLLPRPLLDPGRKQLRLYGIWQWQVSGSWALDVRYTSRLRNYEPSRNDIRLDLKYNSVPWLSTARFEGVYCSSPGLLGYLESGYRSDMISGFFRLTGFVTDGWSPRIYCYERDAPGSFMVPAYYGKGVVASIYGSAKVHRTSIYLRLSCMLKENASPVPSIHLQIQKTI